MSQIDDFNPPPPIPVQPPPPPPPHQDETSLSDAGDQASYYYQQMYPQQFQSKQKDIFADLDKTVYVVIFIAFILGFFMGKTMQPVILRPL